MSVHNRDELLADPDLDDLPEEIAQHPGPFTITGEDEHGRTEDEIARRVVRE